MNNRNWWNSVYRFFAAVVLVCVVLAGQAMAQPFRGSSGEIVLGLGTLNSVAYSPDGKYIATCGSMGAFLWDVETGMVIRGFWGQENCVISVAFSPDGTKVLTGSWDGTAKLWDVGTGAVIRTFSGYMGYVESVAFSPDGMKVLTGSEDGTARIWDVSEYADIERWVVY